jgi:hypothetical protein
MLIVELVVLTGVAVALGLLVVVSRFTGRRDDPDEDVESADWLRVNAEVISVLCAGTSRFLRVRFVVGSSVIHSDVRYPLADAVPHAGRRVAIRSAPTAPARVVFDLHPSGSVVAVAAEPLGKCCGFYPTGGAGLSQDVGDVDADGLVAEHQFLGDLTIRSPRQEEVEDLPLAGS